MSDIEKKKWEKMKNNYVENINKIEKWVDIGIIIYNTYAIVNNNDNNVFQDVNVDEILEEIFNHNNLTEEKERHYKQQKQLKTTTLQFFSFEQYFDDIQNIIQIIQNDIKYLKIQLKKIKKERKNKYDIIQIEKKLEENIELFENIFIKFESRYIKDYSQKSEEFIIDLVEKKHQGKKLHGIRSQDKINKKKRKRNDKNIIDLQIKDKEIIEYIIKDTFLHLKEKISKIQISYENITYDDNNKFSKDLLLNFIIEPYKKIIYEYVKYKMENLRFEEAIQKSKYDHNSLLQDIFIFIDNNYQKILKQNLKQDQKKFYQLSDWHDFLDYIKIHYVYVSLPIKLSKENLFFLYNTIITCSVYYEKNWILTLNEKTPYALSIYYTDKQGIRIFPSQLHKNNTTIEIFGTNKWINWKHPLYAILEEIRETFYCVRKFNILNEKEEFFAFKNIEHFLEKINILELEPDGGLLYFDISIILNKNNINDCYKQFKNHFNIAKNKYDIPNFNYINIGKEEKDMRLIIVNDIIYIYIYEDYSEKQEKTFYLQIYKTGRIKIISSHIKINDEKIKYAVQIVQEFFINFCNL